ncbi:hypothetical protein ACWD4L_23555 [Streptomyces sp. NPDC002596]
MLVFGQRALVREVPGQEGLAGGEAVPDGHHVGACGGHDGGQLPVGVPLPGGLLDVHAVASPDQVVRDL